MRVLIIDDDRILGESIRDFLKSYAMDVDWVYDPRKVMDLLKFSSYDVIVLDLMMPHISGEELLKEIRLNDKKTPILVLTAKSRIEDKEKCFLEGADDYLVKPFEPKELVLRLNALSRRKIPERTVKIGNIEINLDTESVSVYGKEVKLAKKEWLLLKLLVKNRGKFVSTEEILNYVWGAQAVGDEVVRTHIKNL